MILSYLKKNPQNPKVFDRILCKHKALVACCVKELWDAAVNCPMDIFNWIYVQMHLQAVHPLRKMKRDAEEKTGGGRKVGIWSWNHRKEEIKIQGKQIFTD